MGYLGRGFVVIAHAIAWQTGRLCVVLRPGAWFAPWMNVPTLGSARITTPVRRTAVPSPPLPTTAAGARILHLLRAMMCFAACDHSRRASDLQDARDRPFASQNARTRDGRAKRCEGKLDLRLLHGKEPARADRRENTTILRAAHVTKPTATPSPDVRSAVHSEHRSLRTTSPSTGPRPLSVPFASELPAGQLFPWPRLQLARHQLAARRRLQT